MVSGSRIISVTSLDAVKAFFHYLILCNYIINSATSSRVEDHVLCTLPRTGKFSKIRTVHINMVAGDDGNTGNYNVRVHTLRMYTLRRKNERNKFR